MASAVVWLAPCTKETTNYARLCRLLVDGGTKALRHTFDTFHPPAALCSDLKKPSNHLILQSLRKKRILNATQWGKLYPATPATVRSEDFDITLLMLLLRNICPLTIPATGWDSLPLASDASVEANIARVKYYRNEVYGHASQASIDDPTFTALWLDISNVLIELGVDATTINKLKTDTMDPVIEEHYQKLLKEWKEDEANIRDKLVEMEGVIRLDLEQMKSGIENLSEQVESLKRTVPRVEDQFTKTQHFAAKEEDLPDSLLLEESQKQLRSIYNTINKVKIVPWDQSSAVHIDDVYTKLSWLKDKKKPGGLKQRKLDHYTDIFGSGKLHPTPKRILVHGRPGIGKTVFTQKATFDWSQHRFGGKLGRFDLVLLVKLRDVSNLQDVPAILRAAQLLASDDRVSTDNLYDYVRRHQEKVLLILDGYDEYVHSAGDQSPIREIWEKKQLRDCYVVITSRDMKAEGLKQSSDAQFEIDGFDRRRQKEFALRFLKDDQDVKTFFKYLEQQDLKDVAKVPLLLLMLCLVWKEKDFEGLPSSRAMIFFQFIQTLLNHLSEKEAPAVPFRQIDEYKDELRKVGEIAFDSLIQDCVCFPINELPDHVLTNKLIDAGLFQLLNISALNPSKGVYFIHKSLQEFMASLFLKDELLSHGSYSNSLFKVNSMEKVFKMGEVLKFAAEMSEEVARKILIHLLGMVVKEAVMTEYRFDKETPSEKDLSLEQRNFLKLCTEFFFCCSPDIRTELFPAFLSNLGGVVLINPKQLNIAANEHFVKTTAPLRYIFFSYSDHYTEQSYRNLISITRQLSAVIGSSSGEKKASEFLDSFPWRSVHEFFLMKKVDTYLYFSKIVTPFPCEIIKALISKESAKNANITSRKSHDLEVCFDTASSNRLNSTQHALSRVRTIEADGVDISELELLNDVLPIVTAPQKIWLWGKAGQVFSAQVTETLLRKINCTYKLKILSLSRINVTSQTACFVATLLQKAPYLVGLDMSSNPLGAGVSSITQQLSCTPHLEILRFRQVMMTKHQVQELSAAVKQSKISSLDTNYHEFDGNTKPEHDWPSQQYWKRRYPHLIPFTSSESDNKQEQIDDSTTELPSRRRRLCCIII